MFNLRVDNCVRMASGFALLLLLAAQEKVCPWLLNPPARPEPKAAATTPPADAGKTSRKRAKPSLPHILPDAPAPRWPAAWSQTTLRQTTGVRDGVVCRGEKDRATSGGAVAACAGGDPWAWHCFLLPSGAVQVVRPRTGFCPPVDPAVRTCISRTGPPHS